MALRTAERLSHLPVYLFDKLDAAKAEVEAGGMNVIDLSVGDPDHPSPEYAVDALRETALDGKTIITPVSKGFLNIVPQSPVGINEISMSISIRIQRSFR